MRRILILAGILLGSGCQQYDVTVNERVVYTPRPLLTDIRARDPALRRCLQDAIENQRISSPAALEALDCPSAGVASVQGLGQFPGLRRLNLAHNALRQVEELGMLESLTELSLENNRIEDAAPLYPLKQLAVLNLRGNPALRCPPTGALAGLERLSLPRHCGA